MPDILPGRLLAQLAKFTPLQRILLSTSGTNQAALSAYHGKAVTIAVLTQHEEADGRIHRAVEMKCDDTVVCTAESILTIQDKAIRNLVHVGQYGIGQILEMYQIRPEFKLWTAWKTDTHFHRQYDLTGPGIVYNIEEHFPTALYP